MGETSEKRKLWKGLKAGLVIIVVLLVVSLFANIYFLNQLKILKDVDLREINFETHIEHYFDEMPYIGPDGQIFRRWMSVIQVTGTIINMGTDYSHDTKLTVRMYDNSSQLLKSEEIDLGTIGGRSRVNLNKTIKYVSHGIFNRTGEYVSYPTLVSSVTTFLSHS